jgi:hypothetical protein
MLKNQYAGKGLANQLMITMINTTTSTQKKALTDRSRPACSLALSNASLADRGGEAGHDASKSANIAATINMLNHRTPNRSGP